MATLLPPQISAEVAKPGTNDVLIGRGSRNLFNHPGNVRYRFLIEANHTKYLACKTKFDKMVLIREITKEILDEGRVKFWSSNNESGTWNEVDYRTCQDKVSRALRGTKRWGDNGVRRASKVSVDVSGQIKPTPSLKASGASHNPVIPSTWHPTDVSLNQRSITSIEQQLFDDHSGQIKALPLLHISAVKQTDLSQERTAVATRQHLEEIHQQLVTECNQIESLQQRQHNLNFSSVSRLGVAPTESPSLYHVLYKDITGIGFLPSANGLNKLSLLDYYAPSSF